MLSLADKSGGLVGETENFGEEEKRSGGATFRSKMKGGGFAFFRSSL